MKLQNLLVYFLLSWNTRLPQAELHKQLTRGICKDFFMTDGHGLLTADECIANAVVSMARMGELGAYLCVGRSVRDPDIVVFGL